LGAGLDVTTATTTGAPAHAICAYARRIGADLIVMGTHGRTGVSRAVLGSVAEAVVRHSACAVMTIPASDSPVAEARAPEAAPAGHCVVCAGPSPGLICEPCRARIRGEAVEHEQAEERAGRVGTSR
jgi:Universal stress protein family